MSRQGHGACGMGHVAALTHSVVGASISVVQHFEAALNQISSLLLGEFWLVFHRLPHQRLQNTQKFLRHQLFTSFTKSVSLVSQTRESE